MAENWDVILGSDGDNNIDENTLKLSWKKLMPGTSFFGGVLFALSCVFPISYMVCQKVCSLYSIFIYKCQVDFMIALPICVIYEYQSTFLVFHVNIRMDMLLTGDRWWFFYPIIFITLASLIPTMHSLQLL